MSMLTTRRHKIAAAVTAVVVTAGGAAAAVALAAPSSALPASLSASTAPTRAAAATTRAGTRHRRGVLARTDHATFEIRDQGRWVTRTLDRGRITAVSSSSITILRPDGTSVTLALAGTTKYGRLGSASAVTVGDHATVISSGGTATRVAEAHAKGEGTTSTTPA